MDRPLQQKLQQFSATPPEGAWNKIADALDVEGDYVSRLAQFEAEPPAHIWETVEANLQQEATPAKVIPFSTRFRRPMRYAAVACFIAVVLMTVTLTVKRTEAGAIEANSETTVPTKKQTLSNTIPEPKSNAASPVIVKTKEKESDNKQPYPQTEKGKSAPVAQAIKNETTTRFTKPVYSSLNKYVVFNDGDGKLRKVSKKLVGFINCQDNDLKCKQRLQQLRQKMAASVMTTDFTGLLETLRQLH
jgi:hypothetical protein